MNLKTRTFDKLNITTKLLGFGCMRYPTKNGKIDEVKAEAMLDLAYASGVNYFDTAYNYLGGKSEIVTGRILDKYPRDSYFLATKLPLWDEFFKDQSDVRRLCLEQLKKLNKDYVDFYLIHCMGRGFFEKVKKYHVVEELVKLREEGKIRYIGFSFHDDYEVFEDIINYFDWDFCQIQFNYVDTELQAGLKGLKLAESKGIPVIVMEPVKGGSLAKLPEDVTKPFKEVHPTWSNSSWALRFVATFDNVKVILSGMSNLTQVKDNLRTFNNIKELNPLEMETINKVAVALKERVKNGCTGCRYCMPCPAGVDIPGNFYMWNEYYKYGTYRCIGYAMNNIKANKAFADACIKCGKCEKVCPQHLEIRKDLESVVKELGNLKK